MKYVVYLTTYRGNKLPPFYIGSTSLKRMTSGKYFGSVRSKKWKQIFEKELNENRHLFSVQILSEHETLIDAIAQELAIQKINNAVESSYFINEAYASKNFNHSRKHSLDSRELMSKRRKTWLANNDLPIDHQKGSRNSQFGKCWINDGVQNKKVKPEDLHNFSDWKRGRFVREIEGNKHPHFGHRWMHNETESKLIEEQKIEKFLSNGWVLGRLGWKHKKKNNAKNSF